MSPIHYQADRFEGWVRERISRVEQVMDNWLAPVDSEPTALHEAMRYAVLGGGKRVRALLVYAAGQTCLNNPAGAPAVEAGLDRAAAAVELIHAYSLVHDDLPCMDDDALRRGQPTAHIRFGEATAMLAGDALQPLAFEWLAEMPIAPALIVQAVQTLAVAAGSRGMAGGQAIDLAHVGLGMTQPELENMHALKTGAMLEASVMLGGIVAAASSPQRQALRSYARAIGLAFQIVDDILDVTADTAVLGKTAGKDQADNKPTYVSLLGLEPARELAAGLRHQAHEAIAPLGGAAANLAALADFIVARER